MSDNPSDRAARAVLQTLAERLTKGQARDLAQHLPPELAPWLATESGPEPFDVDEFLRRVAEREGGVGIAQAQRDARSVFGMLGRLVPAEEIDDMAAELPQNFAPLVAEAQHRFHDVMSSETFVDKVAERAALERRQAERAVSAVLETLAERISGGEVEDLIADLPAELHAALRTGDELSHGAARPLSLEEFVVRVAEREGVPPAAAAEHARAVFATLREAVPEKEFLDVTAQLPRDYAALAARP